MRNHLPIFVLQKDPAIEKFGWIRENTDMYFKFKPRTVRNVLIWALLIPGAFLYFIKKTPVGLLSIIISLRMPILFIEAISLCSKQHCF